MARQETNGVTSTADFQETLNSLPRTIFLGAPSAIHPSRSSASIGYEKLAAKSKILALIHNGTFSDEIAAKNGSPIECDIILDASPFYAESGGQIGDRVRRSTGLVSRASFRSVGNLAKRRLGDATRHRRCSDGTVGWTEPPQGGSLRRSASDACPRRRHFDVSCLGRVAVDDEVLSEVDGDYRHRLMCHHTATHLLQSAIKQVASTARGRAV